MAEKPKEPVAEKPKEPVAEKPKVEPKAPEKAALPLTDSVCSGVSVPIPTRPEPVTNKILSEFAWSIFSSTGPPVSAPPVGSVWICCSDSCIFVALLILEGTEKKPALP